MAQPQFSLSREKHLDHMVKVVPFIALFYGIQVYIILSLGHTGLTTTKLTFLGCALGAMIGAFLVYNIKHKCHFYDDHLVVSFFNLVKEIKYSDICEVKVINENESFSTVILTCQDGRKTRFFFVDDSSKIKKWIDSQRQTQEIAA